MSKFIAIFTISLFVLGIGGACLYKGYKTSEAEKPVEKYSTNFEQEDIFISQKKLSENLDINDFMLFDQEGDSVRLSGYIKQTGLPLFVFRFSKFDCSSCVQEVMDKINQLAENNLNRDILVLGSFFGRDEFLRFEHFFVKLENVRLFEVPDKDVNLPAEGIGLPYLFQLRENKVVNFLLINKNDLRSVDEYFESLVL